jgi:hypothetical protein
MEVVSAAEGSMGVVSGAAASTEVVSTVVDSGSTGDSDVASDLDAASDFMVAIPTFMAGMDMAAARNTTAPTNAIEQHGALLQRRVVAAGAHPHGATRGSVVIAAGPPQTSAGLYEGVMNMTRIDWILFALFLVTANLPGGALSRCSGLRSLGPICRR